MLSGIFAGLAGSAVLGWVRRRLLEIAGLAGAIIPFIAALPSEQQGVIIAVLTGQGGGLSIAAVVGFAVYVFGQWRSWRATVNPHVVGGGEAIELTEEEARQKVYEATGRYPTNPVHRKV